MDLSPGATAAKDAAKDTKEQAVQAFVSSEERFPPPGKLRTRQSLSKLLFFKSNMRARRVEASEPAKPLLTCFPLSQVETCHPQASQATRPSWGRVRASPSCFFSSRAMEQDASKPRNQQRILCSLRRCFLLSQVVTLPSASKPSCLAKLGTHQSLSKLLSQVEQWSKTRRSLRTSQASSALSRRVFFPLKS